MQDGKTKAMESRQILFIKYLLFIVKKTLCKVLFWSAYAGMLKAIDYVFTGLKKHMGKVNYTSAFHNYWTGLSLLMILSVYTANYQCIYLLAIWFFPTNLNQNNAK